MSEVRPLRAYAEVALGRQRSPQHDVGPHMVPYLRAANVKDGSLDLADVKAMNFDLGEQVTFALRTGDVLVTEGAGSLGAVGASAVWSGELRGTVCFQNTLLRLRPRPSTDPRFLAWWCRYAFGDGLFASVATGANIFHISAERVRSLPMAHLPLFDQRAIADFLDFETTRIEAVIEKKRKLVGLLRERPALLAEERLNLVRRSADAKPLKFLVDESDERSRGREALDLLSVSIHRGVVPRGDVSDHGGRADDLHNYKVCRAGDLVINRMRAFQGGVGVAAGPGLVSPDYTVLKPKSELDGKYLHHLMRSPWFVGEMTRRLRGIGSVDQGNVRTPRVNFADIGRIDVPVPPVSDQVTLAAELDRSVTRCRGVTDAIDTQIRLLVEHRHALIAAAVTGEFQVPEAAA